MRSLKKSKKLPVRFNMLAFCVSLAIISYPAQCGIENDMKDMFDSMGADSNYTKAGSFHNQSMNMYTGGALSVRTPVSNLTPLNMQLPKIEAGCGGIDLFAGAFSFVNKEQFVQFTRNLGNNAAGVAFEIALDSLDPLVGGAIGKIRDLAQKMNQFNLNSCSAAKQLVGGVMGKAGESIQKQCEAEAIANGNATDGTEAKWYCQSADNIVRQSEKSVGNRRSSVTFTGGNVTHEAVKNFYGISGASNEFDIDFITSLTGTVIVKPLKKDDDDLEFNIMYIAPTIDSIETVVNGIGGKNNAMSSEKVTVSINHCSKGSDNLWDDCTVEEKQIPSIRYQVNDLLKKYKTSVETNIPLPDAEMQKVIGLINHTQQIPLAKIVINDGVLGTNLIEQYQDVIVYEYMGDYLNKINKKIHQALGRYYRSDAAVEMDIQRLYDRLAELRATVAKQKDAAYAKAAAEGRVVDYLKNFENHWKGNFPGVASSMAFEIQNRL